MDLVGIKVRRFDTEGIIISQESMKITVQFPNGTASFLHPGRSSAFKKGILVAVNPDVQAVILAENQEKCAEEVVNFTRPSIEYLAAKQESKKQEKQKIAAGKYRKKRRLTEKPKTQAEIEKEERNSFLFSYYRKSELPKEEEEFAHLTPRNLGLLGALDAFYDAYNQIADLYKATIENNPDAKGDYWDPCSGEEWRNVAHICKARTAEILTEGFHATPWALHTMLPALSFSAEHLDDFFCTTASDFRWFNSSAKTKLSTFSDFLEQVEEQIHILARIELVKFDDISDDTMEAYLMTKKIIRDQLYKHVKGALSDRLLPASSITSTKPLYIFTYLSHTRCRRLSHPVESRGMIAKLLREDGCIDLPTHYCPLCDKHFIGVQTLKLYEKDFGPVILDKRKETEMEDGFSNFKLESRLHRLGYNVVDGQLTDSERQKILKTVLDGGELTYFQIASIIEQNIQLFKTKKSHQLAVMKWRKDLRFIGDYVSHGAVDKS